MAATSLATMLDGVKDTELRELILEFFVKADPVVGRCPAILAPDGYRWTQPFVATSDAAAAAGIWDTFTASAFTRSSYQYFLNMIYRMDQRNTAFSALDAGQQGRDDRLDKKTVIMAELGKLFRNYMIMGEPAWDTATAGYGAVGATLAALLGASATVEAGPRCFDFDDVHQQAGGVTATVGSFKWTNASDSLQYKAPGDSYFGPAQVISATNRHKVALFSGIDSSNNPNPTKWCRVTIASGSELTTLLASGNYESDGTAAQGVSFTPTNQPTGWYRQVSPRQTVYPDLTGALDEAGTTACGNGPASGSPLNREALTWMKQKLLDASGGDPSRCAILMSDTLLNHAEGLLGSLGQGVNPVMFMGTQLNTLSYGGIPLLRNEFLPTTLSPADGSRSDLTAALGVCLGSGNAHYKFKPPVNSDITAGETSGNMSGGVAVGDGTFSGTPVPVDYYEKRNASSNLIVDQVGVALYEPVAKLQDLCMVTGLVNG